MAHPNEELLRRGYEAFAKGDLDTVMSIFDEDIVWHEPGRNALGGELQRPPTGPRAVWQDLRNVRWDIQY